MKPVTEERKVDKWTAYMQSICAIVKENHMLEIKSLSTGAKAKKCSIPADKVTGDNIYKALIYFEDFYDKMDDSERRRVAWPI